MPNFRLHLAVFTEGSNELRDLDTMQELLMEIFKRVEYEVDFLLKN